MAVGLVSVKKNKAFVGELIGSDSDGDSTLEGDRIVFSSDIFGDLDSC